MMRPTFLRFGLSLWMRGGLRHIASWGVGEDEMEGDA